MAAELEAFPGSLSTVVSAFVHLHVFTTTINRSTIVTNQHEFTAAINSSILRSVQ
jgi:hypothetical protein